MPPPTRAARPLAVPAAGRRFPLPLRRRRRRREGSLALRPPARLGGALPGRDDGAGGPAPAAGCGAAGPGHRAPAAGGAEGRLRAGPRRPLGTSGRWSDGRSRARRGEGPAAAGGRGRGAPPVPAVRPPVGEGRGWVVGAGVSPAWAGPPSAPDLPPPPGPLRGG